MLNRISGKVQHYAWGGFDYIPALLNITNETRQPFAEYWLGTHPKAVSEVSVNEDTTIALDKWIASDPAGQLGETVAKRFGRLPYLFKVLDVHEMLSIQVHPSKEEAEKGFAGENKAGIPLDAPHRNYKDDNHKPEMMVALSPFYLLHGFMQQQELRQRLESISELKPLLPVFEKEGYKGLYSTVMNMPQEEVNVLLTPLLQRIISLYKEKRLQKNHPDFWAARALDSGMTRWEHIDRGIFSIYFFNLVALQPGDGIFQAAGIPHAYLEGQNIELMANSDNVLRGGLTPKHVDVDELLKHTLFEGIHPEILKQEAKGTATTYPCPVPDFSLEQIQLEVGEKMNLTATSVEIALVIAGEATFKGSGEITLKKGEAAVAGRGEEVEIIARQPAVIFKAGVPEAKLNKK